MAKVTIANLNTLLDAVVTSNIAVQTAQSAVTNATVQAGNAATSAQAAALSKSQIDQQVIVIDGLANDTHADVLAATVIKDAIMALEEAIRLDADQVTLDRAAVATMLGEVLTAKSGVDVKAELIEELVEDFHTKYLGASLEAPNASWEGMELATGMIYYDIAKNSLMIYVNANIWVPILEAVNMLMATSNLADLPDKAEARTNLDVMSTSEVEAQIQVDIAAIKGQPLGLAELDANGLVPASQLPSYVDDVLEYTNLSAFPAVGESGKIYIALDTNKAYRWSGSTYVYITSGAVDSVAGKTGVVVLVKADVGLSNVDNTSDLSKPISTATQTALNSKVDKVTGKGLSTEDYTTAEKTKLSGIESGAQVNTVTSVVGKTGAVTLAKGDVGLSNVDNTSDINKIISTATQTELDLKANRIDVDDLFTDASNLEYDDTFTDMRVADVQAALAHLGEESKYWSNIHSAVRLFGGIIQDNGDGTVRVANGGGLFKKEASSVEGVPAGECEPMQLNAAQGGKLFYENWEATENVQLTNNAYNYIFIVWDHTFDNGDGSFGKARVRASTNFYLQDWESEISYYNFKAAHPELTLPARRSGMLHGFTVGRVYKMDNEITIRVCGTNGWNFNKRVQLFGEEFFPVIRARGLDIQTIPNTLQFNVTEGVMWAEMANRFTVRAFEMDQGDTFTSWYQHTAETTALTLAQIQSTYPTGIANRKYDILYSSTDTKYYRLNPSNNTWGEVLDYINSKVNISTHPANLSVLETLAPTGYVNNSQGTDYVVLQLQATDSFYRYNPNAALGNRWELFGDKSTVHPYVAVAFLGDVAGMNAEYPTGFNDVINVIVGCADGMYYEYSGVSGQSGWKRVQGYIERNGWLRFYKQSAVDALKYNDSTNNKLVDLENGMYGVAWIYMVHDNSCHVVYGQGAYTSEEAKQAALPSPLPGILAAYSTLVGKMTFSRGATTFENSESPFIEKFISSGVSLHNDLAGLDGGNSTQNRYYHLDEPAYNLVNTFADVVDVSPEGDLDIVGDYSGANALFSGNLTVGGTTSGITKTMVGLGLVDNTADSAKNVLSATKLTTARTIGGVLFDGTANINLPGVNAAGNQSTTGNSATATKLATAITIGGVSFDGTTNINLPGVNTIGNQSTTGNAGTATKLATARTISLTGDVTGDVNFDGNANVSITTTVADDSHNHVISNVDGLQTALDSKAPLESPTFTGTPKIGTGNITSISTAVTDNAVVRFDGTTGNVQNSGVVIDDSGNLTTDATLKATKVSAATGSDFVTIGGWDNVNHRVEYVNRPLKITGYGTNSDIIFANNNDSEKMRIDSAGRVTMPYQPAFCVSGLAGTYIGPCTFPFNSFALGVPSQKSINFNTSNGAFTAPISGLYQFNFNIYNFNANDVIYAVFKNGSALIPSDWFQRMSGSVPMTTWSFALYLNSNDYIQMGLRNGAINVYSGHTYFSGYLIG